MSPRTALTLPRLQIEAWVALRGRLGLPPGERGDSQAESAASTLALTAQQLRNFVRLCAKRYDSKRMDPGTPHPQPSVFLSALPVVVLQDLDILSAAWMLRPGTQP